MKRTSAAIRICVACLGGLLLLALPACAKDALGPDREALPAIGNAGGALQSPRFAPDAAALFKERLPDSSPDKQDLHPGETLKTNFGKSIPGLEQADPPPALALTPGINVTLVVIAQPNGAATSQPGETIGFAALRPAEFVMVSSPREGDTVRYKGYIGTVTLLKGLATIDWGDGTLSRVKVSPPKDPAPFGQPVTFTATVSNSPAPTPTADAKGVWKAPAGVETAREQTLGGPDTSQRFKIAENESPRPSDRRPQPAGNRGVVPEPNDGPLWMNTVKNSPKEGGNGEQSISEHTIANGFTSGRVTGLAVDPSDPSGNAVAAPQASGGDRRRSITARFPGGGDFRTTIPIRMIAKDADGDAMPNATVWIQDESGKTVATVTADAAGLVSWTPLKPGKYLFACASGKHIPSSN